MGKHLSSQFEFVSELFNHTQIHLRSGMVANNTKWRIMFEFWIGVLWRLRHFGLRLVNKILTTYKLIHDDKEKIQQTMVD